MPPTEKQFQSFKESQQKPEIPKGTICECSVCGERWGAGVGKCALTCKNCRTKEGRQRVYDNQE